jgi:hypothetical protein
MMMMMMTDTQEGGEGKLRIKTSGGEYHRRPRLT